MLISSLATLNSYFPLFSSLVEHFRNARGESPGVARFATSEVDGPQHWQEQ